ncbi:MAG: CRP-like cAMP-binding protein [Parasphingorhabdus sp.]|jgi:CRP-like cAMP-binding protein
MHELLQNLYLFRQLDQESLALISEITSINHYAAGQKIFGQGTPAESIYIIQHGIVNIEQELSDKSRVDVATLATGSHFGEIAFLDNQPRSGTATSSTESDLVELKYTDLRTMLDSHMPLAVHFYRELARFLSSRLRLTTLDLTYSKSQNISHF